MSVPDLQHFTAQRRDALRAKLRDAGLDAFITFHPSHRRYLTGFDGSFGYALISADGADAMLTDWRYVVQTSEQAPGLEVIELKKDKHLWTPLARALAARGAGRLGFETARVPHGWLQEGSEAVADVAWVATKGWVESLRAIKDAYEIDRLRAAQVITDAVFAEVLPLVVPGVTERELAIALRHRIELAGAENYPYLPIVASGWRAALPHGRASRKRVERGEFVLFDFGAIQDGYHADMTRTVSCGKASDVNRSIYDLVAAAEWAGVELAAAGVTGRAIDRACRQPIAAAGYREGQMHGYSVGHGLGLEVHEDPFLSEGYTAPLQAGMVITVEPGVYLAGETGARVEDTVLITATGREVFDTTTRDLLEL
jgi:Xaa-Pro aminopeptidase